jgi:hypothetical protein
VCDGRGTCLYCLAGGCKTSAEARERYGTIGESIWCQYTTNAEPSEQDREQDDTAVSTWASLARTAEKDRDKWKAKAGCLEVRIKELEGRLRRIVGKVNRGLRNVAIGEVGHAVLTELEKLAEGREA